MFLSIVRPSFLFLVVLIASQSAWSNCVSVAKQNNIPLVYTKNGKQLSVLERLERVYDVIKKYGPGLCNATKYDAKDFIYKRIRPNFVNRHDQATLTSNAKRRWCKKSCVIS